MTIKIVKDMDEIKEYHKEHHWADYSSKHPETLRELIIIPAVREDNINNLLYIHQDGSIDVYNVSLNRSYHLTPEKLSQILSINLNESGIYHCVQNFSNGWNLAIEIKTHPSNLNLGVVRIYHYGEKGEESIEEIRRVSKYFLITLTDFNRILTQEITESNW